MDSTLSNDLRQALRNLTVSQKRVNAVRDLALMNSRDYKEIVHEVERHIAKTPADKRLAGIYVVDAIIRGVGFQYSTYRSYVCCALHSSCPNIIPSLCAL